MKKTFVVAILASALLAGACSKKKDAANPATPDSAGSGSAMAPDSGSGAPPAAGSGSAAM
jgi:hypothetical protein